MDIFPTTATNMGHSYTIPNNSRIPSVCFPALADESPIPILYGLAPLNNEILKGFNTFFD